MEGDNAVKNGKLESYSEEQLVDCVKLCHGCGGGMYNYVFSYYGKSHYAYYETSWPYVSGNGRTHKCEPPKTR